MLWSRGWRREDVPGAKLEAQCIDLADLSSVRSFTERALAFSGHQLDVLLNNAGELPFRRAVCALGKCGMHPLL